MRYLTFSLISFASLSALASQYLVKGSVIDDTGQPNIGVICKSYIPNDSIASTIFTASDTEGKFEQQIEKPGDYIMEFSGVGLKSVSLPFSLNDENPEVLLPETLVSSDAETLEEVVVTARKPLIQSDGATLTYNVDEDPTAKSSSTIEMLRKVPMVTVDAEDNIKVKGQSNFKIYVNGKEDPMLSGDPKTVLKSLPASTIKKIEVITEPGAKYEAEGVGGILNIVTDSNSALEGYLANINIFGSNAYAGASVYGRTKINKVTTSASVSYFNNSFNKQGFENSEDIEYFGNPEVGQMISRNYINSPKNDNINANLNLSWEPDTLNLFTISGYYGQYDVHYPALGNYAQYRPDGSTIYSYLQDSKQRNNGNWGGVTFSAQHNFRHPEHNIVLSYQLNFGGSDSKWDLLRRDIEGISFPYNSEGLTNKNSYFKHTLQLDYTLPLRVKDTFEAGIKGTWRPNTSLKQSEYGSSFENLVVNDDQTVKLKQINDILAIYASYNAKFGKFTTRLGLRYEYTRLGYRYKIGDYPNFISHLNDLVPNAAISYNLTDMSSLRLAYQMRISRPDVSQLNPYVDNISPYITSYGNPDLESARSNAISLSYSNYGVKAGGSLSLDFEQTDNSITDYQFISDNIINSTYANIGHVRRIGLNGNFNWTIINNLRVGLYGYVSYNTYSAHLGETEMKNSGWFGNFGGNIDYTAPWKLRISLYAGGGTPGIDFQGKGSSWNYHQISVSRSFLKEDRLTVSLNANNFFQPTQYFRNHTETPEYISRTETKVNSNWYIGGSISFRFGGLKSDVKSTVNRLDSNETVQQSSGPSK